MKKGIILMIISLLTGTLCHGQGSGPTIPPRTILLLPQLSPDRPAHEAYELYRNGGIASAIRMAAPLAEQGDGDASFLLGFSLEAAKIGGASWGQAVNNYYREAEEAKHPEAALRQKMILLMGGVEAERETAGKALEAAASGGNARACRIMGEAWATGLMGERKPDMQKAQQWWLKAAEAGDISSYVPLGKAVLTDEGRKWLEKAAALKIGEAFLALGDLEKSGSQTAIRNYQDGAAAGDAGCMFRLATLSLSNGDEKTGVEWLEKSAAAGNPLAATDIGRRLRKEDGPANLQKAYRYLLAGAQDGNWQAQYELARIYLDGKLGERDTLSAIGWLTKAMFSGDPEVIYLLANVHEMGIGCPPNYSNAGILYSEACMKGHAGAAERMAHMCATGKGTRRSLPQAWAYATLAAERGSVSAREMLNKIEGELSEEDKAEGKKFLATYKLNPAGPPGRMVLKPGATSASK